MFKSIFLALLVTLAGCAHIKVAAVESAACMMGTIPDTLTGLEGQAELSLFDIPGHKNWEEFAKDDLVKLGLDAAKCVLNSIMHEIRYATAIHGQISPVLEEAYNRAEVWLSLHGGR